MPIVQEMSPVQIRHCLQEAVRKQTPVVLTCRTGPRWYSLQSRLLAHDGERLHLACPVAEGQPPPALAKGTAVGLSFKLHHHKHISTVVVDGAGAYRLDGGEVVWALRTRAPQWMQRVQRRAYRRVEVPRSRSVLATFWQGGRAAAADPPAQRAVTWEGWVTNLSAGGFQVRLPEASGPAEALWRARGLSAPVLEAGDIVGVRIDLGQDFEPILADAQFRHQVNDERGVLLLGFQFVGLHESESGRQTLRRIGRIVCDFRRLQGRRRSRPRAG